ncbi:MAG: hypothetical protein NZ896_00210 [Nitrososphaerales archaeon]|nr:hypothetical protein [Nitrososphaerales archaeon]
MCDAEGEPLKKIVDYMQINYPEASIGLIGCRAVKVNHPICEYDLLIVNGYDGHNEHEAYQSRISFQEHTLDIIHIARGIELDKIDPWLGMALKDIQIFVDHDWRLHSLKSNVKEYVSRFKSRFVNECLYRALMKLARSHNSFLQNDLMSANFWLKSTAYDYVKALITHSLDVPRPSHLFDQIRAISNPTQSNMIEIIIDVMGLDFANETSIKRMVEAFGKMAELYTEFNDHAYLSYDLPLHLEYPLVKERVKYLVSIGSIVQAYCYLSYMIVRGIESLYDAISRSMKINPKYDVVISELMNYPNFKADVINMLELIVDRQRIDGQIKGMKMLIKEFENKFFR